MKKILSLGIALILGLSAMSGCGNKAEVLKETKELTYWAELPASSATSIETMSEMTMYQELEKVTGVKLKFMHPPAGQVGDQFNLMIASGASDLPDIIEYNWPAYPGGPDKAVSDGIILDLTEKIEKNAPNFQKVLDSSEIYKKQSVTDTGIYYGFPSLNTGKYKTFGGLIIRQDWLDDLNLPMPETLEEWETTLTAFKEKKSAIAPFTAGSNLLSTYNFNNIFNISLVEYVEDGKYIMPVLESGYKEYVTLMNKWYQAGLLDKEFDTNNSTVIDAKMTNGNSGVTYGFIGGTIGRYVNAMKDKDPKYKLSAAPFPVKNKGDEPKFFESQREANSPFAAITTNCKKPEEAMKVLDYLYSPEGEILKNFGAQGTTYNEVDGKYVYTDEILKNPQGLSIAEAMSKHFRANAPAPGFNQHIDYLTQYYQLEEQKEALNIWGQYTKNATKTVLPPITATPEESENLVSIKTELDTYTDEMVVKFIKGTESLQNYDKFIEQLKKMGAEKYVELRQKALDRYIKR